MFFFLLFAFILFRTVYCGPTIFQALYYTLGYNMKIPVLVTSTILFFPTPNI